MDGSCSEVVPGSARELTSGGGGEITAADLPFGTYKVSALSVPDPYVFTNSSRIITVATAKQPGDKPVACSEPFVFERARADVGVTLHDEQRPGVPIPSAEFELIPVDANGTPLAGDALTGFDPNPTGETLYTAQTNAEGKLTFPKVSVGRYILVERRTRTGYVLPTAEAMNAQVAKLTGQTHIITVGAGHTVTIGTEHAPLVNAPISSSILTHKVDASCDIAGVKELEYSTDADTAALQRAELLKECAGLDGAEFTVTPLAPGSAPGVLDSPFTGHSAKVQTITSVDGVLRLDNVPYGSYEIKETKAPKGYLLEDRAIRIDIVDNGGVYILAPVTNEREPVVEEPTPDTPGKMPNDKGNTVPPTQPPGVPSPHDGAKKPSPQGTPHMGAKGTLAATGADTLTLSGLVMMLLAAAAALFGWRRVSRSGAQHAKCR